MAGEEIFQEGVEGVLGRPAHDIGRRTLQLSDLGSLLRQRRRQRHRGCAGADDDDVLAGIIKVFGPELRMDQLALVVVIARPLRQIALVATVVAGA